MPRFGALTTYGGAPFYAAGTNVKVLSKELVEIASLQGTPKTESEPPGDALSEKLIHDATVQGGVLYLMNNTVQPYFTVWGGYLKPGRTTFD